MNEDITVSPVSTRLSDGSDGSDVHDVRISKDDQTIFVSCVSESAAIRMAGRLRDIFDEQGAA